MSQAFRADSKVIPYTVLKLKNKEDLKHFDAFEIKAEILITGLSKGKGYAGVMKLWNFSGGPGSHGQKNKHRAPGSIGSQGQGRVIPGKKMAGRMGGEKIAVRTEFVGVDKVSSAIQVKGGIPGSRNSEVFIYVPKNNEN